MGNPGSNRGPEEPRTKGSDSRPGGSEKDGHAWSFRVAAGISGAVLLALGVVFLILCVTNAAWSYHLGHLLFEVVGVIFFACTFLVYYALSGRSGQEALRTLKPTMLTQRQTAAGLLLLAGILVLVLWLYWHFLP